MVVWGAFQIAEERRELESKENGKKHNGEFQRTARKDEKLYLNEQIKEIEGKNRMGKTRDLFKKTEEIKRTFHKRLWIIKDKNFKDLIEAEEIKKCWQEYIELYKKVLNDSSTMV